MLWGFGLAIVPSTGLAVFVPRYEATPRVISGRVDGMRRTWSPMDLPAHERADTLPAWWSLLAVLRWVGSYEAWIATAVEAGWREACVRRFEASVVPGDAQRAAWDGLVDRLETALLDASLRAAGGTRAATASVTSLAAAGTGSD